MFPFRLKLPDMILQVTTTMHILFDVDSVHVEPIPTVNFYSLGIDAAIHLIEVCLQQTEFIAGGGILLKRYS